MDGGILSAYFSDLATNRDVDSLRLQISHRERELDRLFVIRALLLLQSRLREIDESGCIDIDIVKARPDRFAGELLHSIYFGYRINGEFLCVYLEVIALNEDRPTKALAQSGGEHHRDILSRALVGVRDLRPSDLLNQRSDFELDCGAK